MPRSLAPLLCVAACMALVGCNDDDDDAPPPAAMRDIELAFSGLEALGSDYVYEGWLADGSGGVTTTGRFTVDGSGMPSATTFTVLASVADAAQRFILTIEPAVGDDPAPADTHLVAGTFTAGVAALTTDDPAAIGTDFSSASGTFFLATPTTASITTDEDHGIWFIDTSGGGPAAGLSLPVLPAGWVYEGWVVAGGVPMTTGRFTDPAMADSDAGGPGAGPDPAPPFPGQDFIVPPLPLSGTTIVLSVEPEPDNSPAPFTIKPLVGTAPGTTGTATALNANPGTLPTGTATIVGVGLPKNG